MFSYGLGDAGTGLGATQFGFFLFKFFISACLPVIIAGSLLMLIKIWDAVNDPLIGWLSDRTKSRWGPRITWMVAASVPLGFSLAAIWWTPTGSVLTKTIYYAIISIVVMTAYTSINLPFAALSTEISEKTAIRTRLNASRFTGSIIAGLTGLIIAGVVLGSEGSANNEYFLMGKISGFIAVAATLISCWGLAPFAKKARRPSGKVEAITLQFKRIFRNKKFLKVITLYILLWCALQLMQTVALIYVEDVLNVPTYIAKWIPIPFQISALVGLQIWTRVSNKLNRISALNYGAIMWIISCTAALFLPSLSKISGVGDSLFLNAGNIFLFILLIFIICLIGIGASTAFLIPWSLLPDAIDEDPEKPAGLYTAWMVLIQKIGIAFSVQLLGFLLYLSGYQSCFVDNDGLNIIEQCYSAQLTIRLCIGFIPSILVIIGLLIMRKWDRKLITNLYKDMYYLNFFKRLLSSLIIGGQAINFIFKGKIS